MTVLDLTYVISPAMPVYPGTEGPTLSPANTYEKDGFKETLLSMYSHTGTHMDAPAHLFADRSTLDELPAGQFVGKATVIDCTDLGEGGLARKVELAGKLSVFSLTAPLLVNLLEMILELAP